MASLFLSNEETAVGVEVNPRHLKAVVLEGRPEGPTVRGFALIPRRNEGLAADVRRLRRKLGFRARTCSLAVWEESARISIFPHKLASREIIRNSVLSSGSGSEVDVAFDCHVIREPNGSGELATYLTCATPRALLKDTVHAFVEGGMEVDLIQLTPVAIFNAFAHGQQDANSDKMYLVADFGPEQTFLMGIADGSIAFLRLVNWGTNRLGVDANASAVDSLLSADPEADESEWDVSVVAEEIRRSVDYMEMHHSDWRVTRLYVSGMMSSSMGLRTSLAEQTNLLCMAWNPLRGCIANERAAGQESFLENLSRLPAAAGAALQSLSK